MAKQSNDHPKMLFKKGSEIQFEGASLDTLTVNDPDAEAAARKDGWADLADALKAKTK